jgi:hypothetical protein
VRTYRSDSYAAVFVSTVCLRNLYKQRTRTQRESVRHAGHAESIHMASDWLTAGGRLTFDVQMKLSGSSEVSTRRAAKATIFFFALRASRQLYRSYRDRQANPHNANPSLFGASRFRFVCSLDPPPRTLNLVSTAARFAKPSTLPIGISLRRG